MKVRAHRAYLQLRKLLTDGGEEPRVPRPFAAELVLALGAPPLQMLSAHLLSCIACQRELPSYARFTPCSLRLPSSHRHTLQQIEGGAGPLHRAPARTGSRLGCRSCFSLVGTMAALSTALHEHAPQAPLRALLIALLATGIGLFPFAARLPPAAVVAASLLSLSTVSGAAMLPLRALGCLLVLFGVGAVAAAILTRLWARRFLHGGAQAAVIGFGGLAVQTALCSVTDAVHVTTIHLLPVLAGYALGVLRTPGAAPR